MSSRSSQSWTSVDHGQAASDKNVVSFDHTTVVLDELYCQRVQSFTRIEYYFNVIPCSVDHWFCMLRAQIFERVFWYRIDYIVSKVRMRKSSEKEELLSYKDNLLNQSRRSTLTPEVPTAADRRVNVGAIMEAIRTWGLEPYNAETHNCRLFVLMISNFFH